jgi:hypothetical protein
MNETKTEKRKTEQEIPSSPILRQRPACAFLGVSIPLLFELERLGIVKRHELKRDGGGRPIPFYVKDELVEAIKGL